MYIWTKICQPFHPVSFDFYLGPIFVVVDHVRKYLYKPPCQYDRYGDQLTRPNGHKISNVTIFRWHESRMPQKLHLGQKTSRNFSEGWPLGIFEKNEGKPHRF